MRPRNATRTRWLLVVALAAAPGCLFRPIFHPPSQTGSDASASDSSRANTDVATSDVYAPFDAGTSMDAPSPPPDDCRDYFDSATGMYYPDAHHADGALCELPSPDAGADVSVSDVPAAVDVTDVAIDATSDDATDDAASDDAATDDVTSDDASSDDASGDDAATADDAAADDTVTDDATDPDV